MNERYLWDIERLEIEHEIRELCKSAEKTKLGDIDAFKFPIDAGVSYYRSPPTSVEEEKFRRRQAENLHIIDPETPLHGYRAEGNVVIFKKEDLWLAQMDLKVSNPVNVDPNLGIYRVSSKALAPNTQRIMGCSSGGYFGHIYTVDGEFSSWSIHVGKPVRLVEPIKINPIKEVGVQGVLVNV